MNNQQEHADQPASDSAGPRRFIVEPTCLMILMSEKGTDNIRKIYFLFRNLHFWSVELKGSSVVTVDHSFNDYETLLEDDEQNGLVSNILLGEVPCLDSQSVSSLFHVLWTKAAHGDDYDKKQWQALARILYERGFDGL